MNAKELAEKIRTDANGVESLRWAVAGAYLRDVANAVEELIPKYRPPQPSDDGKYCYLEELPDDAPPTLVKCVEVTGEDEQGRFRRTEWMFWTVAGWRELTKGVWPCERPERGA